MLLLNRLRLLKLLLLLLHLSRSRVGCQQGVEGIDGGGLLLELGQALGLVRIDRVALAGTLQKRQRAGGVYL